MANVYDIANELDRELRALPEYKAAAEAKVSIDSDEQAKALWDEFLGHQEKFQMMMQTGQMPTADEQKEMNELGQRIEANPTMKAFFEAQQRLSVYVADIEKIVFSSLRELN